jgi:hypothetical protein
MIFVILNTNYNILNIKKGIVLFNITPSAGHELSGIYHLYNLNLLDEYEIVISNNILKFGTFIESVLLLFINNNKIHYIDEKTIVNIEESFIYYPCFYKNTNGLSLLLPNNILLNKLSLYNNNIQTYKNVCIIKSCIDGIHTINTRNSMFSQSYLDFFKENNFEIISPNSMDVITLYNIINNCDNLILSWGCNSWINSLFVNEKTNVLVLCHIEYLSQYQNSVVNNNEASQWTPKCNKLILSYDLESELTDEHRFLLQNQINELIN